jgi:hypothetical protein
MISQLQFIVRSFAGTETAKQISSIATSLFIILTYLIQVTWGGGEAFYTHIQSLQKSSLDQALIEMGTWILPVGKGQPVRKVDSLTSICEPIV